MGLASFLPRSHWKIHFIGWSGALAWRTCSNKTWCPHNPLFCSKESAWKPWFKVSTSESSPIGRFLFWVKSLGIDERTVLSSFRYSSIYGYGSIPINTIFSGMNIHLPAILGFTRGERFWHTAISHIKPIYITVCIGHKSAMFIHRIWHTVMALKNP